MQGLCAKLALINGCNRALLIMFTIKTKQKCPSRALSFTQSSVYCSRKLPQVGKGLFPQIYVVSVSLTLVTRSHWGMLWGHLWVIRNTKTTGSMRNTWIPLLSPWHIKTAAPSYKDEENRLFPEIRTIAACCNKQSNGLLLKKKKKQLSRAETNVRPTQNSKEKNQFLFCPNVYECVDTHHPSCLGSCLHSHHRNAYLTKNSSLKNWGKTSSTLHSCLLI